MGTQVDASNSCIPPTCNLTALTPPLPTATRGEPVYLDGKAGRINSDRPVIVYGSGRLVIVRELSCDGLGGVPQEKGGKSAVKAFVYRGHTAQVSGTSLRMKVISSSSTDHVIIILFDPRQWT